MYNMSMNKITKGLLFGTIAGIIDVTPMVLQKLSWDADLSAFIFWIVAGFIIATSNLKTNSVLKGILISFLVLTPVLILIAAKEPISLVPISVMTLILGGMLGYFIERFNS